MRIALGIVLIIVGVFIDIRGRRRWRKLDKYEFEHRTEGGVVTFPDYEAAQRHRRRKVMQVFFAPAAGVLYLIGLALVLLGYFRH